MKGKLCSILLN